MTQDGIPIHPRKLEIVEASIACFLERGYHQTGVRDIAARANISLGNVYNHFKGKEEILAFIAEMERDEQQRFIEVLSPNGGEPLARLRKFIAAYAEHVKRPENALLGVELLSEALRNDTIASVFDENRSQLIKALSACLAAGKKAGAFAEVGTDRETAYMIVDAIEGYGLRSILDPRQTSKSPKTLERFILAAVEA